MSAVPLADRIEWWPRANLRLNPRNARVHSAEQLAGLSRMMRKVWTYPCLVTEDAGAHQVGEIIAGHGRFMAAPEAGYHDLVKVMVAENWPDELVAQYMLFDNQIALQASWDDALLIADIERLRATYGDGSLADTGFSDKDLKALLDPEPQRRGVKGSLAAAFGVPPFSVMVAREGYWQDRKRAWLELGIRSEIGRADHVEGKASHKAAPKGGGRLYGGQRKGGGFAQQTKYGKAT